MSFLNPQRHRCGSTSLIEMAALTFVATIALGLVGSSLASLSRVDARFDRIANGRSDLDRLMLRIRADIRAAQTISFDAPVLELATRAGSAVRYSLVNGRAERDSEGALARFRLPSDGSFVVSTERLSEDRLVEVAFLLNRKPNENTEEVLVSMFAELNRDERRSQIAGGE